MYRYGGVITTMNKYFALALLTACLVLPVIARADVFNFSYINTGSPTTVVVTGLITADPTATPGLWAITGLSGTRHDLVAATTQPITLVVSNPNFNVDNEVWIPPNPTYFNPTTNNGFIFSTPDGNLFDPYLWATAIGGDNNYYESQVIGGVQGTYFNPGLEIGFSAESVGGTVPEPTSVLFMGTVLLGLAGAMKRKWA